MVERAGNRASNERAQKVDRLQLVTLVSCESDGVCSRMHSLDFDVVEYVCLHGRSEQSDERALLLRLIARARALHRLQVATSRQQQQHRLEGVAAHACGGSGSETGERIAGSAVGGWMGCVGCDAIGQLQQQTALAPAAAARPNNEASNEQERSEQRDMACA